MKISKVTAKGQITIPAIIRRKRRLRKGSKIILFERGREIILLPYDKTYFRNLIGISETKGKAMKSLIESKKKENGMY